LDGGFAVNVAVAWQIGAMRGDYSILSVEGVIWANCVQRHCRVLRRLYNTAEEATAKSVRNLHSGDTRKYSLHAEHVNSHLHWEPHAFLTADRFKLASIEPVQLDAVMLFHCSRLSRKLERRYDQMDAATRPICMMRGIALSRSANTCLDQIDQFVDDNYEVGNFARNLDIVFCSRHR